MTAPPDPAPIPHAPIEVDWVGLASSGAVGNEVLQRPLVTDRRRTGHLDYPDRLLR
jgi:hypothetical protein